MEIVIGELVPLSWGVVCPQCLGTIEIENVGQDDAGVYYAENIDTAPECPRCHVCVETNGVSVENHTTPRFTAEKG